MPSPAGWSGWPIKRSEDCRCLIVMRKRRDDMVALAAILGKALQLQHPPAKMLPDRAVGEDRCLGALGWNGNVGQGQQAAAPPKAGLGPIKAKAIFAQKGADQARADTKRDEQNRAGED